MHLCKRKADSTTDLGKRCKRNSMDFCLESVMGCGESGEAGCVTGWDSSGGLECDECEIAGCVTSWDNIGCDCATTGSCFGNDRADCRTESGRRCKYIWSCCCCRFGIGPLDELVSGNVSLGSFFSVFSCSCGGGDCLSQPARQVPK